MTNLPYQLSAGVTATNDFLIVQSPAICEPLVRSWGHTADRVTYVDWLTVAERLRYINGEAWCSAAPMKLICGVGVVPYGLYALHRVAAIIVDDSDAFFALYDCIQDHL